MPLAITKLLYGSKTEKSKYQAPDGQVSLFEDDSSFNDSEHTEEQSQQTCTYTVVRKVKNKKRNDSLRDNMEIEVIHHHPENTICDCCQHQMTARMMRVQHIEHAYECKNCKVDSSQPAQIKRGKAHYHVLDLSLKASLRVFLERLFARVIQPMISWPALPSQIVGRMYGDIG